MKKCIGLLLVILACSFTQAQSEDRGYIVKVGDEAPDIELLFPGRDQKTIERFTGEDRYVTVHRQLVRSMSAMEMPFNRKRYMAKAEG